MKNFLILLIILSFQSTIKPHKEYVHQYIVNQAYELLRNNVTNISSFYDSYFRDANGQYYPYGAPIHPSITAVAGGAWAEDQYDIVFGYCGFPLPFTGCVANTASHFWNPDGYLYAQNNISGIGNVENAFKKGEILWNGNHDLVMPGPFAFAEGTIEQNLLQPHGFGPMTTFTYLIIRYYSLADLIKNQRFYLVGVVTVNQPVYFQTPLEVSYGDYHLELFFAANILGRMCHLLTDMSVPGHVRIIEHPCDVGSGERYEMEIAGKNWYAAGGGCNDMPASFPAQNYTYQNAMSQGGLIKPWLKNNPLKYLFYTTAQITDVYNCYRANPDLSSNTYNGNRTYNSIDPATNDNYSEMTNIISSIPTSFPNWTQEFNSISSNALVYTIRSVAGLLYWFGVESGLIPSITLKNNFNAGTIKLNENIYSSGELIPVNLGYNYNLTAIPQVYNNTEYIWNDNNFPDAPNAKSYWAAYDRNNYLITLSNNYNLSYNLQITTNENFYTFFANLRKRCKIDKIYSTEFDGNTTNTTWIVEQNSGQITAPSQQTINGKTYNFAGWTDNFSTTNTRTITPVNNEAYTALYKYPFHSNNESAYSTNSQRKFVRTPDSSFHSVYESMGYVWYEKSSDGGSTWQLMNSGKPVGNREAKSPSICFLENTVFITYQYDPFVGITWFNSGGQSFIAADSIMNPLEEVMNYETDASPVIEAKADRLLLVYRNNGLKYNFYQWYAAGNGDISFLENGSILNSDANSITPTLAVNKNTSDYNFHLAWGQGDNIIRYQKITSSDGTRLEQSSSCYKANLAANDGYTKNYIPSLVVLGDDLARASWIGERNTITDEESIIEKRAVFRGVKCDNTSFSFWNFGYDVRSATIQKSNDNANYFIIWNEENGATKATNNTTLSVIKNLSTAGHYVQVCNGATKYDMYGMVFNSSALPYTFNKTNNIQSYFENPSKEKTGNAVYAGREGTVNKDGANIYYTVGDVLVDGSNINFKEITETTEINSNEDVKRYLETEPFELNDNSSFLYSIQYGLTENPGSIFNSDEFINFKVKLVDTETNAVISVFDDVNYNANNLLPYNSIQYSVNTNGIGNRTVILMLDIEDNFNAVYSVTSKFSDAEILPKAIRKEVGLGENFNVTEYDLSQNYPNPFNPSTTIRYQIPQDGIVTLKIYDILGREVITVVNEVKSKGRYEVVFDASQLASGLYIYEITSGSFKASKKMTLIK